MRNYFDVDFSSLNKYLDSLLDFGFPSYDCIVMQNHNVIFRNFKGYADFDKKINISDNNLYYFYSITKLLTSVCVLQLAEKGLLKLDDYVYDYIPNFKNQKVQKNEQIFESPKQIKIINLLTMTSGVGYGYWDHTIKDYINETGDSSTVNVVSAFGKSILEFIPGEKWCYGFGMDIAAAIVEIVSGYSFPAYVKKFIFDPIGMSDSSFKPLKSERLAKLYEYDVDTKSLNDFNKLEFNLGKDYYSGGGGLISSTYDYSVFADCLACNGIAKNGYVLLKPESVNLMSKNALDTNTMSYFRKFGDGQYIPYGYGLGVRTRMSNSEDSYGPIGEFGWGGASGSLVYIDNSRNLSLMYSQHTLNSFEGIVLPGLRDAFFKCIESFESDNW